MTREDMIESIAGKVWVKYFDGISGTPLLVKQIVETVLAEYERLNADDGK